MLRKLGMLPLLLAAALLVPLGGFADKKDGYKQRHERWEERDRDDCDRDHGRHCRGGSDGVFDRDRGRHRRGGWEDAGFGRDRGRDSEREKEWRKEQKEREKDRREAERERDKDRREAEREWDKDRREAEREARKGGRQRGDYRYLGRR